jgi:hypothetical protein
MSTRFNNRSRKCRIEMMEAREMMAGDFGALADVAVATSGEMALPDDPLPGYISTVQEFNLNSLPGAPHTLFLDFNGHFQAESMFDAAGFGGYKNILTPAYNTDSDPYTFSPSEQNDIRTIWALVAEDFAPFNINVTTVDPDPGRFRPNSNYLRVVISGDKDFTGSGLAGAAEKDWTGAYNAYADDGDPNVVYAFQKAKNGVNFNFRLLAEACSHEAAHAFGVDHYDPNNSSTFRAAIMEEDSASQAERGVWFGDDMEIIASSDNGFGFRADDFANSFAGAGGMTVTNAGLYTRGLINWHTDVDMFRFETGGGSVNIKLDLPHDPFLSGVPNLDAKLSLYNANGGHIATVDDPMKLDAVINQNLAAGSYYVAVSSHGVYGDVGKYSLLITEKTGAHIVGSSFQTMSTGQLGVTVSFNEVINALSFTAADVRVNGGIAGVGVVQVTALNPKQFLIVINAGTALMPSVSIGPNITDLFGNRMDQNKNGINGEAADYYYANYFNNIDTIGTKATTLTKTRSFTTLAADAYFERF